MVSGALLLQTSKVNEPIRVFLKKRLIRIGLAFAFWSAIYFAWDFFVFHQTLSTDYIIQALLSQGPHYQFWYIYALTGLYLLTPILRTVIAFKDHKILLYITVLWVIIASIIPLFQLITGFSLDRTLLVLSSWVGYFVLGTYLLDARPRSSILYGLIATGFVFTIGGSWLMSYPFHSAGKNYFFLDFLAPNVILYSVAMFLLLKKRSADWPGQNHRRLSRFVHVVSHNTLPIFLFHPIILESFESGFFGFKLSATVVNPIYEIPLAAFLCFFVTVGVVLVMKKVPVLKKLIG